MVSTQKCLLCGSALYKTIYEADTKEEAASHHYFYLITENKRQTPRDILKCKNCGLIFAEQDRDCNPFASSYIEMVDMEYVAEESGRRKSARNIIKKLGTLAEPRRRLLEIGCSTGFFLDEARRAGWDVYGIELSKWAVRYGKEKFQLRLFDSTLERSNFPAEFFDVVVMQHVIEHLHNPTETLREVERILVPNGVLFISTPDISCFFSRLFGKKWWGISMFHLYYFSPKTVKKLLTMFGFTIIQQSSFSRTFTMRYWSKRIKAYNLSIFKIISSMMAKKPFADFPLGINLHDELNIFARKEK